MNSGSHLNSLISMRLCGNCPGFRSAQRWMAKLEYTFSGGYAKKPIPYQAIEEKGLLGLLTPDLFKELVQRIDTTSQQLAVQEGVVDAGAVSAFPKMTTQALTTILFARIAQIMVSRVGVQIRLEKAIGGRLASAFFGPVAWVAIAASTIYDIVSARSNAVQKCKDAGWKSYNDTAEQLLGDSSLRDMPAAGAR